MSCKHEMRKAHLNLKNAKDAGEAIWSRRSRIRVTLSLLIYLAPGTRHVKIIKIAAESEDCRIFYRWMVIIVKWWHAAHCHKKTRKVKAKPTQVSLTSIIFLFTNSVLINLKHTGAIFRPLISAKRGTLTVSHNRRIIKTPRGKPKHLI